MEFQNQAVISMVFGSLDFGHEFDLSLNVAMLTLFETAVDNHGVWNLGGRFDQSLNSNIQLSRLWISISQGRKYYENFNSSFVNR